MRLRPRRPLVVAAAALLAGVAGAVAVASPAMAAEYCDNLDVTNRSPPRATTAAQRATTSSSSSRPAG